MTWPQGSWVPPCGDFLQGIVIGFLLGVAVGAFGQFYLLRRLNHLGKKENHVSGPQRRSPVRNGWVWWESFAKQHGTAMQTLCVALVTVCIVGLFWQNSVNQAQDRRRTEDNTRLIECFDKFATDLSGSLPPVRVATANRDAKRDLYDKAVLAALVGNRGLGGLLIRAQQGIKSDPKKDLATLIDTFALVQSTARALDVATAELTKVRAENPYPPPPSKFCELP